MEKKDKYIEFEHDSYYRLRRELEDKLQSIAEEKVNEKVSKLEWRYGSIALGLILGASLFGYSEFSDIPKKIEDALNSETSKVAIKNIQEKEEKIDVIYTNSFNLLKDLEEDYSSVTEGIVTELKGDSNFQKRLRGSKGEPGKDGSNGTDGKDGINGLDGQNGINGKDGMYANILEPQEIGRFEVIQHSGESILTFTDTTKNNDVKFVTFILGPGFNPKIVNPKKSGSRFTFKITKVVSSFEATAIIHFKNENKKFTTPYLYSVIVSP